MGEPHHNGKHAQLDGPPREVANVGEKCLSPVDNLYAQNGNC